LFRIFGYGNPFRQDDGAGHYLAPLLVEDLEKTGKEADLWLGHQLLPEAASGIGPGDILVFVDASLEKHPEGFALEPVHPDKTSNPGLNIHSFGPPWFLALLGNLGMPYREAWSLSVTGGSFDFGDGLTDTCLGRSEKARDAFREKFC
jgi:hydrogenase maturation protease